MLLSIDDAAARLGKSARQVRYLIRLGQLEARKVSGRWLILRACDTYEPHLIFIRVRKTTPG